MRILATIIYWLCVIPFGIALGLAIGTTITLAVYGAWVHSDISIPLIIMFSVSCGIPPLLRWAEKRKDQP